MACVLEDAALFLGTLRALAAGAVRGSIVTDREAGEKTGNASIGAVAALLEPAAATSAVIVETEPEEIAWNSSTGASTTGDWVALTSGIGAVSLRENVVSEGREMVLIDESPDIKDCEATTRLGLTA